MREVSTGVRASRMVVPVFNQLCAIVRHQQRPQWFVEEVAALLPRTVGQERVRLMNEINCTAAQLADVLAAVGDGECAALSDSGGFIDDVLSHVLSS